MFITASNAVHIYWFSYIHSHFHLFITSRVYLEPKLWPAPSWIFSSVGRAQHRYRRGLMYRIELNFFQSLFCSEKKIAFIFMSYAYNGFTKIAQSFTRGSVKFPNSPILHCAFSSWIEKTMTKTIHCHWENRFVLQ